MRPKIKQIVDLLRTADEDYAMNDLPVSDDWLGALASAASKGNLSSDEKQILSSYRNVCRDASQVASSGPGISQDEKKLLSKWRKMEKS